MREIGTLLRELKRYGNAGRDCALAAEDALAIAAAIESAREDAEEVARWRFVRTLGKLPVRCSTGYYYEDGVLHPTLNEAIDQARGNGVAGE